jgi:hypothetical protein
MATKTRAPRTAAKPAEAAAPVISATRRLDKKWSILVATPVDPPVCLKATETEGVSSVIFGARVGAMVAAEIEIDPAKAAEDVVRACRVHSDRMAEGFKSNCGHPNQVDIYAFEIARGKTADEATTLRSKLANTKTREARAKAAILGVEETPEEAAEEAAA